MAQIGSFLFLGAFLSTQITTSDAAYACAGLSSLKADASTITCRNKDCSLGPLICCDADSTSCTAATFSGVLSCGTKRTDATKTGNTTEACCVDKTLCSASACTASYKLKTDAATTLYCVGGTCTPGGSDMSSCCEADSTKCRHHTCGTGKTRDRTKDGDTGATDAACCKDQKTCASATPPAAEQCAAIGKLYDTTKASEVEGAVCCKADATKCASVTCGSDAYLADAAATGTTPEICCPKLPTCSSYVAPVLSGAQQFSSTHHTFAMLFCVLISSVKQL